MSDPAVVAPHPLSLWSEYAKTIIGLATGVLAIVATFITAFADRIVGTSLPATLLLTLSSACLFGAIWCSIYVAGGLIGQARADLSIKGSLKGLAAYSNASFYLLFGGLVVLFVFVLVVQRSENHGADQALRVARAFQQPACSGPAEATLEGMAYDQSAKQWNVTFWTVCHTNGVAAKRHVGVLVSNGQIAAVSVR